MKTSLLRRLDTVIGLPAAWLLGILPRCRVPLVRQPKEIIVVKLFGLGSIILIAAVLQRLKKSVPAARITLVTFGGNEDISSILPVFDEVLTIRTTSVFRLLQDSVSNLFRLRQSKADLVIDLEYFSKLSTVFCRCASSAHLRGFLLPAFWRRRLVDSGITFREDIHFADSTARLLHHWCGWCNHLSLQPPATLTREDLLQVEQMMHTVTESFESAKSSNAPWILINPNAHDMCIERRWPPEKFRQLIERFAVQWPKAFFGLLGSPRERLYVQDLYNKIDEQQRHRVALFAGRTTLPMLLGIMTKADLLVGNDSGIMHLGALAGIPQVALFGPESPLRYRPLASPEQCRILSKRVVCGPCLSHMNRKTPPCRGDNTCMKRLSVDTVLNACNELLEYRYNKCNNGRT